MNHREQTIVNREIRKKRRDIDKIDQELLRLLHQRARVSLEIGALKSAAGAPPFVPTREREILESLAGMPKGPFPETSIGIVFREIISACRYVQQETQAFVLDERLGISYSAALAAMGSTVNISCIMQPHLFLDKLENTKFGTGILPFPSAFCNAGPVWEKLLHGELHIIQDLRYMPSLVLATRRPAAFSEITRLFIPKEVFPLVRPWLNEQPQIPKTEVSISPENAFENLVHDNSAAIVSEDVALSQGLEVISAATALPPLPPRRFFLLARRPNQEFGKGLSGAVLFPQAGKALAVMPLLKPFEANSLTISNLDRIALSEGDQRELVLVEFQTPENPARLDEAIQAITAELPFSRFLGYFPVVCPNR
jgi:chorismate mutase/prephenate dehydratase